jgi:hypothetical protein
MKNLFRYCMASPDIIRLAVMLSVRLSLSLRHSSIKRRARKAAMKFLKRVIKWYGQAEVIVTDKLRSYRTVVLAEWRETTT